MQNIDTPQQFKIEVPGQDHLIGALDRGFRQRSIITILGPSGCGKSWLLQYWSREGSRLVKPDQVAFVRLRRSPGRSLPMACIVLSRLRHQLVRMAEPAYRIKHAFKDEEPILYTERHFHSLVHIVVDLLGRLPIGAVVVDNAHLLDEIALEWLLDIQMEQNPHYASTPHLALILAGTVKPSEYTTYNLAKFLSVNEEAQSRWREQITLDHLTKLASIDVFGQLFGKHLKAKSGVDLDDRKFADDLWQLTKGNWWSISRLAGLYQQELEALPDGEPRMITQALVERVNQHLFEISGKPS